MATQSLSSGFEIVLAAVHTTNPVRVIATYLDQRGVELPIAISSNGTTAVTILSDDVAIDKLESIIVHNADTVSHTVTLRSNVNGVAFPKAKVALDTLETLYYERGRGWYVVDANGKLKVQTAAGGGGGGDSVQVNTVAVTDINLNDSTPAAPAGDLNVKWQRSGSGPDSGSAYVDVSVLEPLLTLGNLGGTLAISKGGTGQTSQTAAMDALSPTTTKGDLLVDDGSNVVRVAVGSDDKGLVASAAAAAGVAWKYLAGAVLSTWCWGNLAASQTNLQGTRNTVGSPPLTGTSAVMKMRAAGRILGVGVAGSAARSGGTATFTVFKNGSTTGVSCVIDGTNTQQSVGTGDVTFAKDDLLDVRVTTDGSFSPTTTEYLADIWIVWSV